MVYSFYTLKLVLETCGAILAALAAKSGQCFQNRGEEQWLSVLAQGNGAGKIPVCEGQIVLLGIRGSWEKLFPLDQMCVYN